MGPMRPLAILNFDRLKSIRIEMDASFWELQMIKICPNNYGDENPSLIDLLDYLPPRFSLIDNAPNLENLSIEYNFNEIIFDNAARDIAQLILIESDLIGEFNSKQQLQLIIVYLGNHSI